LPRGGVAIGFEVAKMLKANLDVLVARKIGAPGHPEFGVGAVAEGGIMVFDQASMAMLDLTQDDLRNTINEETVELERRVITYRGNHSQPQVKDKVVIVVDDGLATGVTAQAAVESIRLQKPKRLIFAVPVCSKEAAQTLQTTADEFICLHQPQSFTAVGVWYENFRQLSDEDVIQLLGQAHREIRVNAK
jgi:putative phosphoribosyl transferase